MNIKTASIIISMAFSGVAAANEANDKTLSVLNQTIEAYGGDTLRKANQISVTRDGRLAWDGQGYDPLYTNYVTERYDNHFDFTSNDATVERWISQNGSEYHTRSTTTDQGVAYIDYISNEYTLDEKGTLEKNFTSSMIYSDILLAASMVRKPEAFTFLNDGVFEGRPVSVLSYQYSKDRDPMKLFIDHQSGFIVKTLIGSGDSAWLMTFRGQKKSDGLMYSSENVSYYDGKAVDFHVNYTVTRNAIPDGIFQIDKGLQKESEKVSTEGELTTKVKPGVYHVGSDGSYSVFFKNNSFITAVNVYTGGFKKKNAQFNSKFNEKKLPLKYVIITHHHNDQIGGIQEAIDEGATLIMTPMTKQILEKKEIKLNESQILVVEERLNLGDLEVHLVATSHSAQNLIVYQKEAKVMYQDDHYYAEMKDGPSYINSGSYELFKQLTSLNINPEILLGGHSPKAEQWIELKESFESIKDQPFDYCPSDRRICSDKKP